MMIEDQRIVAIAKQVANSNLSEQAVEAVVSEPTVDSEGREALRITIVIKPRNVARIKGDAALDTLFQIQNQLLAEGEERPAIVEYATKKEFEQRGDAKS